MLFSLFASLLPTPTTLIPRSGADFYRLCQFAFLSTPLLVPLVHIVHAPHGRFSFPSRWNVNGNIGWFIMEVVSPITFLLSLVSPVLTSSAGLKDLIQPDFRKLTQLPAANAILATAFVVHYIQRAILHPLRSARRSPMHISVPLCAVLFNLINGFLMGSWIGGRSPVIDVPATALDATMSTPLDLLRSKIPARVISPGLASTPSGESTLNWIFALGMVGWAVGFAGNVYHDEVLLDLRRPKSKRVTSAMRADADSDDEGGSKKGKERKREKQCEKEGKPRYGIPKGGLFRFVSFPNYLCEWFEWASYAVAALSITTLSPTHPHTLSLTPAARFVLCLTTPPALFLLAEFCPMFPRALTGHQWYHERFGIDGDGKGGRYPRDRKAVIPFLV